MTDKTFNWETFKAEGANVVEKIKAVIREGNVRRVVIEHEGKTVAEFPLTVGAVGAVFAPVVAAIAAVVALFQECTIRVERDGPARTASGEERPPQSAANTGSAA